MARTWKWQLFPSISYSGVGWPVKNVWAGAYKWLLKRLPIVSDTFLRNRNTFIWSSSHPGGGEEPVFPSSLTLSWVRQLTSGQYGKDRNWMYSFQEACFRGEADPPPSLSPLLPNGWNVNLIAAAPAATLNHKNHCQLKPQMGEQDRRKPDTMSLQYQLWTKW